ncbi:MAG TPA: dephospho-CoA kinase [Crocinitomicaceae bacterium]|nr:dephospho-CoA kinase [Crocinitomicaceae bacterium]
MKKIGITGGVGAGKSFVCQLIEEKGFPVFYSDVVAKEIMTTDKLLIQQIISNFGKQSYLEDKSLNKTYIAELIFNDNTKRELLNSLVHPAVYRAFEKWCQQQTSEWVFLESALMIDTGNHELLDIVILVVADHETRMERIAKRDDIGFEKIMERMNAQSDDTYKKQFADFVIDNSKGKDVKAQLDSVLEKI